MVDGRRTRTLETRERIRAAAWELFTTVGFDATTTSAIAKRAGVAAGTVFIHASDKADLLFLVMYDRLATVCDHQLSTAPEGPLLDRLLHVFGGLYRMYGEQPGVAAAFIRSLPGATGPNAQRVSTLTFGFMYRISLLVAEAQRSGEVSSEVDPMACAQNVFGLYFMALMAWLSGHASLESALVPLLRDSLALQIRGFRP
jgi:AcrR family transcriptional regulator